MEINLTVRHVASNSGSSLRQIILEKQVAESFLSLMAAKKMLQEQLVRADEGLDETVKVMLVISSRNCRKNRLFAC